VKPVGIAVLGCGTIGEFHLRAIREIPGARLAGISAQPEARAREIAAREQCVGTADYRELLGRPEVDLVTIATPSGSHAKIALEALDAGKHVLVEKPMAMTAEDASRVIRRAAEKNLVLSVVSQRRLEEQHQAIRRALDAGALGRLLVVESVCPFFRPQEYYAQAAWRGTKGEDGGALMNQGIHSIDLMLWFGGRARTVYGRTATRTHRIEAEDVGVALVSFESGAFGTVLASTSIQPGFPAALNLYGEKGSIRCEGDGITHWSVPGVAKPAAEAGEGGGGVRDPRAISHRGHRTQIENVLEAIRGRAPLLITGEDGRRAVELVEAIYRSSETGQPVELGLS
jgi:predicted dehydrogenase